ncbi:MAG: glucosaminidase domain-containing protein [Spongiibacteraceae bacterium]|jgi:Bax protein|nr:glucosaminidase domain-containing protein [Spongiibacteraceae bacterium]
MQSDEPVRGRTGLLPLRDRIFVVVTAAALLVGALLVQRPMVDEDAEVAAAEIVPEPVAHDEPLPDFSAFRDAREKKQAFFDYLRPMVEAHNQRLLEERESVQSLAEALTKDGRLTPAQQETLAELAERYRIDVAPGEEQRAIELLLQRVDIIPVSLALIQSANESGWGTSRFAREANNLFGEKCFRKGCGIAPAQRPGAVEYARFDRPDDAVASYMHNLNTHPAYRDFRKLRSRLRERDEPLTGPVLADGLHRYSERGKQYVQELRGMIWRNKLQRLDEASSSSAEATDRQATPLARRR